MRITDIALEPGEKILGEPASGDVVRWLLALGKSMQGGVEQWHVYLKPTRPDLETNLAINTDRRSYLLELHSYEGTYMAAIVWHYPEDELARLQAQAAELAGQQNNAAPVVGIDALNFNYAIQVVQGAPAWTPVQVFDDGRRTFVRFPSAMVLREAPALFVLRDSQTQLVNYRVKNDTYVIDRLIDAAELRVGQKDQEIVRILRTTTEPASERSRGEGPMTTTPSEPAAADEPLLDPHAPKLSPDDPRLSLGRPRARTLRAGPIAALLASLGGAGVLALALAFQPSRPKAQGEAEPSAGPPPPVVPDTIRHAQPSRAALAPASDAGLGERAFRPAPAEDPSRLAEQEIDHKARGAGILFESAPGAPEDRSPSEVPDRPSPTEPPAPGAASAPAALDPNLQEHKNAFLSGQGGVATADYLRVAVAAPAKPLRDQGGHGPARGADHGHQQRLAWARGRASARARLRHRHGRPPARPAGQSAHRPVRLDGRVGARARPSLLEPADPPERRLARSAVHARGRPEGRRGPRRRGRRALVAHPEGRHGGHAPVGGHCLRRGRHDLVQPLGRPGRGAKRLGEIGQVGAQLTRSNLSIQPTLTVRPGFSVNVIVTKDMILAPYPDPPAALGLRRE